MKLEVQVTNALGLNASNAPHLVQLANNFKSSIWIETDDRRVNAKSLLGVISLGVKKDMKLIITAEGSDETEAVAKLAEMIEKGFAQ